MVSVAEARHWLRRGRPRTSDKAHIIEWITSLHKKHCHNGHTHADHQGLASSKVTAVRLYSEHVVSVLYSASNNSAQVEGADQTQSLSKAVLTISVAP